MSEIDNEITKYISVLEYKSTLANNSFILYLDVSIIFMIFMHVIIALMNTEN